MKFGKAHININKPVEAGSFQKIVYTFEAEHAIDDSGYIKIVFRRKMGIWPGPARFMWSTPDVTVLN